MIEHLHRLVTCRLLGHRYDVHKMSGTVCRRCRAFRHR